MSSFIDLELSSNPWTKQVSGSNLREKLLNREIHAILARECLWNERRLHNGSFHANLSICYVLLFKKDKNNATVMIILNLKTRSF